MKELSKREKNLMVAVLGVCTLGGWWYMDRQMSREAQFAGAEVLAVQEQIRQTQSSLNQLQGTLDSMKGNGQPTGPVVPNAISTMALLKDLTLPQESLQVKIVSVTRADGTTFNLSVEGNFGSMMRFLSYLEREKSKFSVGNVSLAKSGDTPRGGVGGPRQIRASLSISMKG